MTGVQLTDAQRRALEIVRDHGPIYPSEFGKRMWPDHDGHRRYVRCGPNGVTRGGGMRLAAGGFLGKLAAKGWIRRSVRVSSPTMFTGYALTNAGRKALSCKAGA